MLTWFLWTEEDQITNITHCMNKTYLVFLFVTISICKYLVFMKRENFFNLDIWYDVIEVCVCGHKFNVGQVTQRLLILHYFVLATC